MDVLLLLIIIIIIYKLNFNVKNFNKDYLKKDNTDSIKGVFIIFVFFRHFTSYVQNFNSIDMKMLNFNYYLDQLIVVMFLFYSGYGISLAIKGKGRSYIKGLPVKRILPVIVRFDLAVFCYLLLGLCMGKNFTLKRIILSLLGVKSLGNSNWYIFGIVCLYIITFLSGIISKNRYQFLILNFVGTCILIWILKEFKEEYWYNTLIAYFFGLLYAVFQDKFEKFLFSNLGYIICMAASLILYQYSRTRSSRLSFYCIMVISFAMIILLITMKLQINNQYLIFGGRHLFSLYIFQRIPMIYFENRDINMDNMAYFMLCIIVTILLAIFFDYFTNKVSYNLKLINNNKLV